MELYEEEAEHVNVELPFKLNNDVKDIINDVISIEAYGMIDSKLQYFYISFTLGNLDLHNRAKGEALSSLLPVIGDYESMRSILQNAQNQKVQVQLQLTYEDGELKDFMLAENALANTLSDVRFNNITIIKHDINNESVITEILDMSKMPKIPKVNNFNDPKICISRDNCMICVRSKEYVKACINEVLILAAILFIPFWFANFHKPSKFLIEVPLLLYLGGKLFIIVFGHNSTLHIKDNTVKMKTWYGLRKKRQAENIDKIVFEINSNQIIVFAEIYMGKVRTQFALEDNINFNLMVEYMIKNVDNTKIECYVYRSNERVYVNSLDELLQNNMRLREDNN